MVLLAINTLVQDAADSNPMDSGFIDRLYGMIRDTDPVVVVNCLSALEEILSEEGGIVINKNMSHYLLSKLHSYPTWVQIQVLDILKKYHPGNEDELFDILNVVDGCLENNSPTVVTTAIQLFMGLLENLPHLQTEIFKRAKPTVISHLGSGNAELSCALIDIVSRASGEAVSQFSDSCQSFFCRNKDPYYLKSKKIALLPRLVTEDNGDAILEELSLYCVDHSSPVVSLQAIRAVGLLQQKQESLADACKEKLNGFYHSTSPHILSNILQVLQDLDIQDDSFWESFTTRVCSNHHMVSDSSGKSALLYLLGLEDTEVKACCH
nr:hypothetical protein BaRGS_008292 [Batillaria attramentaria]